MLIVFAVEIRKRCLQTASPSERRTQRPSTGALPEDPTGGRTTPWAIASQVEIAGYAAGDRYRITEWNNGCLAVPDIKTDCY